MESASFCVGYEYNKLYGSAVLLPGECGDWLGGFPLLFVGFGGFDGGELGNMLGSFHPLIEPVRFCADFTLESVPSSILLVSVEWLVFFRGLSQFPCHSLEGSNHCFLAGFLVIAGDLHGFRVVISSFFDGCLSFWLVSGTVRDPSDELIGDCLPFYPLWHG